MGAYVLDLTDIDRTHVAHAGGKGAHLGELTRIDGTNVPPGYVVATAAYQRIIAEAPALDEQLDRLARQVPDDRDANRAHAAELRRTLEAIPIPDDLAEAITRAHARLGEHTATAVRSSATAEDQPTTSFAGQHDSYLNVRGTEAILHHVRRCWASLHTERAVAYRQRNGIGHRAVHMAVVVQRMVDAEASGILFTADPVTGNRTITTVEATHGLGEALVTGRANADAYKVRGGEIIERTIGATQHAVRPALTDAQVHRLAALGRRIEAHFGRPQDVEWCLEGDRIHVVQSRPITTLYPVPEMHDGEPHVYLSVGHQQMMTDAMKPLGLSFWQMTAARPMAEAGGRLFVDVTRQLATPASRAGLMGMIGKSDPLIGDALQTLLDRGDFIPTLPDDAPSVAPPAADSPAPIDADPAIVADLIARTERSLAAAKRDIRGKTGPALLDFIHADVQALKRELFDPESHQAIMAGIEATWWLNEQLHAWLGETSAADVLTRSVPHNVTSEMGLALLDVADRVRPHPEVVAYLQHVEDEGFLDALPRLPGGQEARDAIQRWLDRYGMRCPGEIDITRPRWSERPSTLVPLILANVAGFAPGEAARRFERGRREAEAKERELLERLRGLPDGERKAAEAKRMIDRVRTFIGYREYPKYGWMARYFVYRRALMEEAARLVRDGVLREPEDVDWLTFAELHDAVRTHRVDDELIRERKDAFRTYEALTPPRVLTSDGEMVAGAYRRGGLPDGALVGLAVSAGTVEGRARVVLDMAAARLEPGDILVTAFTDPSWTPLFVAVAGLVTEVGGLMTHGAVIAREYGLPAVVGVEGATRRIRDGQRIRVHGTEGYVEILR